MDFLKYLYRSVFLCLFFINQPTFAVDRSISINNETNFDIFMATYYKKDRPTVANRTSEVIKLPGNSKKTIVVPSKKLGSDRRLLFSLQEESLKKTFTVPAEYGMMSRLAIGLTEGNTFHITSEENKLVGYNTIKWGKRKIQEKISPFIEEIKSGFSPIQSLAEQLKKKLFKHPYSNKTGSIRRGTKLSQAENSFIQIRKPKTKKFIESFLNTKLKDNEVPTVALVFTGGGYRAMIESLGYLQGAANTNILDISTYMCGLSGSTWAITPWVASNLSINQYIENIYPKVDSLKKLKPSNKELLEIMKTRLIKQTYGQGSGLIGLYGSLIVTALLEGITKNKYSFYLTDLQKNLTGNAYPMPIITAIEKTPTMTKWFEFTPYESGTHQFGGIWTNTEFVGRKFENGKTINFAPPQPLGYLLGICGSAFALSLKDLLFEITEKTSKIIPALGKLKEFSDRTLLNPLKQETSGLMEMLTKEKGIISPYSRAFPGIIANFSYKLSGIKGNDQEKLSLVDGGHDLVGNVRHNFASIPTLWRGVDILILCDSGREPEKAPHLRASEGRARTEGFKFPPINYENVDKQTVSMFVDEKDLEAPIVVYMIGKENKQYNQKIGRSFSPEKEKFTSTSNFAYTKKNVQELSGLTQHIMEENKSAIIEALKKAVERKKQIGS